MDALLTAVVSGLIVAIASALLAFYFGGVRERQKREYEEQKEAQRRQEGLTERLTQVTAQLGSNNLETKLGAIYALEAIAKESDAHYWPVMEVLTAYVREHAPWPLEEGQTRGDGVAKEKPGEDSNAEPASTDIPPPDPDVQAIMTVIGRRTHYRRQEETELLDLRGIDLRGADLRKANFVGADLSGANFSRAELRGADLRNANLMGANLSGTILLKTNLSRAQLHGANLSAAHLVEADLSEVNKEPSESRAWFIVDLRRANLSRANLSGANLMGADLRRATLWKADLRGAGLAGADLREANLSEANLGGADLEGAEGLTQALLEDTTGDEKTKLPPNLKPPAHWGVKTDEQPEED